jgi:hypothetical protein
MGETDDDVVDLALSLRALEVRSVPVNFLIPIPGTAFEHVRALDPRRCLRVLCLYRFLLPSQEIRIAGGREVHLRSMQAMGLYAANSIFIGDYLTTQGAAARADLDMIRDAGFVLETPDGEEFTGDAYAALAALPERVGLPARAAPARRGALGVADSESAPGAGPPGPARRERARRPAAPTTRPSAGGPSRPPSTPRWPTCGATTRARRSTRATSTPTRWCSSGGGSRRPRTRGCSSPTP